MSITKMYDIIISTVCLQFLQPESTRRLWQSAKDHTVAGGYHLLIAPVMSEDIICPFDFSYLPPYEEYLGFYDDWEILLAENAIGQFHKKDANGQRVRSRFATIIARKPLHTEK